MSPSSVSGMYRCFDCGFASLSMTRARVACHPERSASGVVAIGLAKR